MNILDSVWILCFLTEIYFNITRRAKRADSKGKDKNPLRIIRAVIYLSIATSIFIAIKFNVPILTTNLLKYLGLILMVAGVIIRFVAIRTPGTFFTVNLSIDHEYRLVNKGL